jgi:hypothetical protein
MKHAIMRHAFWTVAVLALIYALAALFDRRLAEFVVVMVLFGVAVGVDLRVHQRGWCRDRSAVLLLVAAIAIVVAGVFAQIGVWA